jgi:hypothetical protein
MDLRPDLLAPSFAELLAYWVYFTESATSKTLDPSPLVRKLHELHHKADGADAGE